MSDSSETELDDYFSGDEDVEDEYVIVKGSATPAHSTVDNSHHSEASVYPRVKTKLRTPGANLDKCIYNHHDGSQIPTAIDWFPEISCTQNDCDLVKLTSSLRGFGQYNMFGSEKDYTHARLFRGIAIPPLDILPDENETVLRLDNNNYHFCVKCIEDVTDDDELFEDPVCEEHIEFESGRSKYSNVPVNLIVFISSGFRELDSPQLSDYLILTVIENDEQCLYRHSAKWRSLVGEMNVALPGIEDHMFVCSNIDRRGKKKFIGAAYRYFGEPKRHMESILIETALRVFMFTTEERSCTQYGGIQSATYTREQNYLENYASKPHNDCWKRTLEACDDEYGWIQASVGPGLDLVNGKRYSQSVMPANVPESTCKLREIDCMNNTMRRLLENTHGDGGECSDKCLSYARCGTRYSAFGLSTDQDEDYIRWLSEILKESFAETYATVGGNAQIVSETSASGENCFSFLPSECLRYEARATVLSHRSGGAWTAGWMKKALGSTEQPVNTKYGFGPIKFIEDSESHTRCSCDNVHIDDPYGRADFSPYNTRRPPTESAECTTTGMLSWRVPGGWSQRIKLYPESECTICPQKCLEENDEKKTLAVISKIGKLDLCENYAAGLSWVRGRKVTYRYNKRLQCCEDAEEDLQDSIMAKRCGRDHRSRNAPMVRSRILELALTVFAGSEMRVIAHTFFCGSSKDLYDMRRELCKDIVSMTEEAEMGPRETDVCPFSIAVSDVHSDTVTGSRRCVRLRFAYGGLAASDDRLYASIVRRFYSKSKLYSTVSASGGVNITSTPEIGMTPCRLAIRFTTSRGPETLPSISFCYCTTIMPFPFDEASILGREALVKIPSQIDYMRTITAGCGKIPLHDGYCLGLFFPLKGFSLLTTGTKQALGEWLQRFRAWFQWGAGSKHYETIRKLVPLCNRYMVDATCGVNFYRSGILMHLHCIPDPDRERNVVDVMARAFEDSQLFSETSLCIQTEY
ncbi:protein LORF5 [Spheniscid alphaherpesvirus 1]|uniref:Protein LORF5 n=1 Tax=Spheniscid alphaherpesvirus 1 TaxID=2560777 RepID=A0A1R3T4Y6_9ALPH|nr:protein LORF5 [Spheniscid alphaherpesvirus 1]